jgi:hypothetical protein
MPWLDDVLGFRNRWREHLKTRLFTLAGGKRHGSLCDITTLSKQRFYACAPRSRGPSREYLASNEILDLSTILDQGREWIWRNQNLGKIQDLSRILVILYSNLYEFWFESSHSSFDESTKQRTMRNCNCWKSLLHHLFCQHCILLSMCSLASLPFFLFASRSRIDLFIITVPNWIWYQPSTGCFFTAG